jgi:hypothetical protein
MTWLPIHRTWGVLTALLALSLPGAGAAWGHCDSMDGPVVAAAIRAIETREVDRALIWVRAADEPEIRDAFARTLAAREAGSGARELADRWFFETLVRVHREGEGAPYTGLKPAGTDPGPAITEADAAVASGSLEAVERLLLHAVRDGLRARFQEMRSHGNFDAADVGAGREWVHAYVAYVHYVERLHQAATGEVVGHAPAAAAAEEHARHR